MRSPSAACSGTPGYEAVAVGKTHYYDPLAREFDRCIDLYEHEDRLATKPSEPSPPGVRVPRTLATVL